MLMRCSRGSASKAASLLLVLTAAACGRAPAPVAKSCAPAPAPADADARHAVAPAVAMPPQDERAAIATAEASLVSAALVPKGAAFRGVIAWHQAMAGRIAVCGQTAPFGNDRQVFVPFVTVLAHGAPVTTDRFVGATTDDADRVYEAVTGYCFEGGGPVPALTPSPLPIPPLPNDPEGTLKAEGATPPVASSAPGTEPASARGPAATGTATGAAPTAGVAGTSAPPAAAPPSGVAPASGTVTTRQDANLHVAPQGLVIRVLPAGTALRVFATAPGGWIEVGTASPEGWLYSGMTAAGGG